MQDGVYAVGGQDEEDDSSSSSDDEGVTRADAILDGGAADNMFNVPPECFDTYKKCNASWNTAKRSVRVQAKGQGRIYLRATSADDKAYNLQVDAFHVPELASNLLSVYYLCNRGYQVVHALPKAEIRVNDNLVFECPVKGRLWYLPLTLKIQPHHSYVFAAPGHPDCLRELHERHAHAPLAKLKAMAVVGELDDEPAATRVALQAATGDLDCVACAAGKLAKKRGEKHKGKGKGPQQYKTWEMVSVDDAGPYPRQFGGFQYFSVMIDHGSELLVVTRKHTCDARTVVTDFDDLNMLVINQLNKNIKHIRIDRGPANTAQATRRWASSKGILLEYAPPDGHGEIGRAEALIGALNRAARTLMKQAKAPHYLFFHAVLHLAQTRNRTYNPRIQMTPFAKAWGRPHRNKTHLPWGCLLVLTSPRELEKGETGREEYGAFLGVDHSSRGGVMALNLNTNKIIHRRSYRAFLNKSRWPKQRPDAEDKLEALQRVVSDVVGNDDDDDNDDDSDDDDAREGGESDSNDDDVVDMVSSSDDNDSDSDDRDDRHVEENSTDDESHESREPSEQSSEQAHQSQSEDDNMEDEEHEERRREHEQKLDDQYEIKTWPESKHKLNSDENGMGVNLLFSQTSARQENEKEVFGWACACALSVEEQEQPRSLKQAFARPDAETYVQASVQEIKKLLKYNSFKRVKRTDMPKDAKPLPTQMVFTDKLDEKGKLKRKRGRIVARGDLQGKFGREVDTNIATYSPTPANTDIRTMVATTVQRRWRLHQGDVEAAYLHTKNKERTLITFPKGFGRVAKELGWKDFSEGDGAELLTYLYGMKQSGREWYFDVRGKLVKIGFEYLPTNPCVMIRKVKGEIFEVLLFHVDDFLHSAQSEETWENFLKECRANGINIEGMGEPKRFLGLYFEKMQCGWRLKRLHLEPYIYEVLKKFKLEGLSDAHQPAPMNRLEQTGEPLEEEYKKLYRPLIGVALWTACVLRGPDIGFSVIQCASFSENPTATHWKALLRIFAYLKATANYSLEYVYTRDPEKLRITSYVDASWAVTCYGGHITFGMGGVLDFKFSRIRGICKSSHEAEVVQASKSATTTKGFSKLWEGIGVEAILKSAGVALYPIRMLCDNEGAIATAGNELITNRTKHIAIADLYIKQAVQEAFIDVVKIDTKKNLADLTTKPLSKQRIRLLVAPIYSRRKRD